MRVGGAPRAEGPRGAEVGVRGQRSGDEGPCGPDAGTITGRRQRSGCRGQENDEGLEGRASWLVPRGTEVGDVDHLRLRLSVNSTCRRPLGARKPREHAGSTQRERVRGYSSRYSNWGLKLQIHALFIL